MTQVVRGRLLRDIVAPGSKSERLALLLEAEDGQVFTVRRAGAVTFGPDDEGEELERLADDGARVTLTGTVRSGTLLVSAWQVADS